MRILVTGGAGFIGSHVVDLLIEAGHHVAVVDNLTTGRRANLNPAATFYEADIRSPELREVFAQERPEVVSHHAAQMDVRRSMAEPLFDADNNILGSLNVLECARAHDTRKIIYISSGGAVYGEPEYLPCDEAHPVKPLCPYGASKYIVEKYCYLYRENYGLDYTVLRYPNVYGPRQNPEGEAGVVAIFAARMLADETPIINGTGEQARDFVYVLDCARANLLALEQGDGAIYNLASGVGTTIGEIWTHLRDITGYGRDPVYGPAKAGETFRIYLDATRARDALGWQPTVALAEGLKQTADSLQQRVNV